MHDNGLFLILKFTLITVDTHLYTHKVDWPEQYQSSELAQSNKDHADNLVKRDVASLPPLHVEGGQYAAGFGTQVGERVWERLGVGESDICHVCVVIMWPLWKCWTIIRLHTNQIKTPGFV